MIVPVNKHHARRILNLEDHDCMIGDILFRMPKCDNPFDDNKLRLQLVIPDALANSVIAAKHDQFLGTGHAGFVKCLNTIKRKYYITDLTNKLKDYISKCGLCLKLRNTGKPNVNVPLKPAAARSCTGQLQKIQCDFAGPFNSMKYSSKYVLVVTDEFSQYSWLFATDTASANDAFACLNKLIRIYGIPSLGVVSDRGSSFTSEIMTSISRLYGINWTHDLSSNPTSTGLVENRVKMVKQLIKYITLRSPDVDLYDSLLDVQFSLNCTASSVTGLSPHFVFHGYEPVNPIDHNLQVESLLPSNPVRFAEELQNEAVRRKDLIKQCKILAARQMKHTYDRSIAALPELNRCDLVLLETHNHPRSSKTMRKFKVLKKGPYRVHSVDNYHCVLRDLDGNILNDLYPVRKLHKIEGYRDSFPVDRETVGVCLNNSRDEFDFEYDDRYYDDGTADTESASDISDFVVDM